MRFSAFEGQMTGARFIDFIEKLRADVKRRIMIGTYALRSGYYDAYYKKAQQVRALIKRDFDRAFEQVDVLLAPTTPTPAFAIGEKSTPIDMYLGDVFTLACNLAGIPGLAVPVGATAGGLPIGAQLVGRALDEATLLRAGAVIEAAFGTKIPGSYE
jgi:aspartyl-tRNA(Asn)/glutamyl-tRNA(Gln) amidotransferase subunit A